MAFASIFLGSLFGFCAALFGFVLLDFSLWQSLAVYCGTGVTSALLILFAFVMRPPSGPSPKREPLGSPVTA